MAVLRCDSHVRFMALSAAKQMARQVNRKLDGGDAGDAENGSEEDDYDSDSGDDDSDGDEDIPLRYLTNTVVLITGRKNSAWRDDLTVQAARSALPKKFDTSDCAKIVDAFIEAIAAVTETVLAGVLARLQAEAATMC